MIECLECNPFVFRLVDISIIFIKGVTAIGLLGNIDGRFCEQTLLIQNKHAFIAVGFPIKNSIQRLSVFCGVHVPEAVIIIQLAISHECLQCIEFTKQQRRWISTIQPCSPR